MSEGTPTHRSDSEWSGLSDEKEISKARRNAENQFRDFTSEEITQIRKKLKHDLFFLATALGYSKLSPNLHKHYTDWIQSTRGDKYRLSLLARGHYKSTVKTICDSIQMALPNDEGTITDHPYSMGTNVKILIAHEVRETASDFLFEITAAFTRKEVILAFFPECVPSKNIQRINKWELELPRSDHPKEATFNTIGAGGASQGGHYNHINLDDLIGKEARDSPTVMMRIIEWFNNILSLTTDAEDGFDLTGTRWSTHDVYSHAMQTYGISETRSHITCIPQSELEKYKGGLFQVYARGALEDGKAIFPELMTAERIKIIRKDPMIWAAQYANNPRESGLTEFPWKIKKYNVDAAGNLIVFTGDSSYKVLLSQLDIVVLCDPSMGLNEYADESGIIVTGTDSKNNIFILETVKKRLKPPELIDNLFRIWFRFRPRVIAIEKVNFSGIYKFWMQQKADELKVNLPIRDYNPGSKRSKETRIRGLSHFFSAGQVYIAEGMHMFQDEYEQFPLGNSFHLLDAFAQGPDFWKKANSQQEVDNFKQKQALLYEDYRSELTGY